MNVDRNDAETWATWFKALGDPRRIVILNLLATAGGPLSVAEIVDAVDVGQSTVSHHLKSLVDAGILTREQRGKWAYYRLVPGALDALAALIASPAD